MCKIALNANRKSYLVAAATHLANDGCAYFIVDKITRVVGAVGCVYADYGAQYEVVKAVDVTEITLQINSIRDWDNWVDKDDDFDEDE